MSEKGRTLDRHDSGSPRHPDGRPMRLGEMAPAVRRDRMRKAAMRMQTWFEHPDARERLARALADPTGDGGGE